MKLLVTLLAANLDWSASDAPISCPTTGTDTLVVVSPGEAAKRCREATGNPKVIACHLGTHVIILPDPRDTPDWKTALLLRHELAHHNGCVHK